MKKLLFTAILVGLLFTACKDEDDSYPPDVAAIQEKIVGGWGTAERSHWFTEDGIYYFNCPACNVVNVGTIHYSIVKNDDKYFIRMTAPGYETPQLHQILEITNSKLSIIWHYIYNDTGQEDVLQRININY